MNRKLTAMGIAAAAAALLALPALSQAETLTGSASMSSDTSVTLNLTGSIESVDQARQVFKVKAGALSMAQEISVNGDTQIQKDSHEITLGELSPGDQVKVRYRIEGQSKIGERITVESSA